MLLDTASLYYRSFFALPSSMTAPDGFPHNAVRGLLQTIERLRSTFRPKSLIAAWDNDWRPAWRVDLLASYKTHRLASPDDLAEDEPDELGPQIGAIHRILDAWGLPVVGVDGYEADDVVGTLATQAAARGLTVVVVTGDRDLVQLVDNHVRVLLTVKGGMDAWPLLDAAGVSGRFGVRPDQYLDMAALRGDPSDGLPGVRGIGDKTAVALISHFGSLTALRAACTTEPISKPLTPRLAQAVIDSGDYLSAALEISAVCRDVPIDHWQSLVSAPTPTEPVDPAGWTTVIDTWGVRRFAEAAMSAGS